MDTSATHIRSCDAFYNNNTLTVKEQNRVQNRNYGTPGVRYQPPSRVDVPSEYFYKSRDRDAYAAALVHDDGKKTVFFNNVGQPATVHIRTRIPHARQGRSGDGA